ncbi:hypothetical protein MHC_04930 [Mycoplasma haemocanis str. Illinois]|uniref:Uncharacterized protein n=1 Tax=Mycoplasma haemocanis (strain Illinois) TaxID=1111676 RepID=H6N870_MYCHN|nr:hypothetical protein [Mycoplasma haemocanis]AEW45842.1 hypothetical protein MHC_04930 [Mycoplasma haemocanis str. Illinois]
MALSLKIAGFSGASMGAAGLGGYVVYSYSREGRVNSEVSYRIKLNHALLNLSGSDHQSNWEKRLNSLKAVDDSSLVEDLKSLKKKQNPTVTWTDIQAWCRDNIDEKFIDEKELKFSNLRTYCVFSISEKIPSIIATNVNHTDSKWTGALSKFKDYSGKLSSEFATLKATEGSLNDAQKLKTLCEKYYDKPFLSEEDEEFKSVKGVCIDQQS